MKFLDSSLRRFMSGLPSSPSEVRRLMDSAGLEVKSLGEWHDDFAYTIEFLANRGDLRCYMGVARELTARIGGSALRFPELPSLVHMSSQKIRVETERCFAYSLTPLEVRPNSPREISGTSRSRLDAAFGLTDLVTVDVANLVSLDFGQPTHAFDADKIDGTVTVRESIIGESLLILGETKPRELEPGTLVIADEKQVLAVAGVIGGELSRVTRDTRRVLLESACFDPVSVARAARSLKIHTTASLRFERGGDPSATMDGAAYAISLVREFGVGDVAGETMVGRYNNCVRSTIPLDVLDLNNFLSTELSPTEVSAHLGHYGFVMHESTVIVPSWRMWDVIKPEDLYEEVGRSIGFNQLETRLPSAVIGATSSEIEIVRDAVDQVLLAADMQEIFTDSFYGRQLIDRLGVGQDHPWFDHIRLVNSIDPNHGLLKNNCLAQAAQIIESNQLQKVASIRFFERTRTFTRSPEGGAPIETPVLWGVLMGTEKRMAAAPADFAITKGIFESLSLTLNRQLTYAELTMENAVATFLHPRRCLEVSTNGVIVGILGEVHPSVAIAFGFERKPAYYFELYEERLPRELLPSPMAFPDMVPMDRELDFVMPSQLLTGKVKAIIAANGGPWLLDIRVADVYTNAVALGENRKSVTFALLFANSHGRLGTEIKAYCDRIVAAVSAAHSEVHLRTAGQP